MTNQISRQLLILLSFFKKEKEKKIIEGCPRQDLNSHGIKRRHGRTFVLKEKCQCLEVQVDQPN